MRTLTRPPSSSSSSSTPTSNEDNNMVLVAEREYCDGSAGCSCGSGGAGHLVSETRWVDDSTSHTTEFEYDWRGRQLHVFPPADDAGRVVYTTTTYDNLDRAVRQERYLEIVAGTDRLLARSDSFWSRCDGGRLCGSTPVGSSSLGCGLKDDRGRVFQTARHTVDVETGEVGNALVSNTWYDAVGSVIKQQPAGSQAFTKTVFDSLGRAVKQYLGHDPDETAIVSSSSSSSGSGLPEPFPSPGTYADASSIADDTIVEQSETTYDDAGNVLMSVTRQRFHNATGTDELTSPSGSQPKARISCVCMYHDQIGRQIAVANGSYPDEDVTVEMTYNADGQISTLTAKNPTPGDQTTTYVYGTTLTDSGVATSTLKWAEIYPDSDDTPLLGDGTDGVFDRIEFCYNRQSQRTSKKDQNGSIHQYDARGRMTHDRVTTVGSGVDDAFRRISTNSTRTTECTNSSTCSAATSTAPRTAWQNVFKIC